MSTATDVMAKLEELREAIKVQRVQGGRRLGDAVRFAGEAKGVSPVDVLIMQPSFDHAAYGVRPSGFEVEVVCIVPLGDQFVPNVVELALTVAEAIDANTPGAVITSRPQTWNATGSEPFPAQVLTVQVPI